MKVPDLYVGKRLIVGDPTIPGGPTALGKSKVELRGGAYIEAPMIVGDDTKFPLPEATMMIGRCTNLDAAALIPGLFRIRNLIPGTETPQDVVIGDPSGPVGVTVFCGASTFVVEAAAISLITIAKVEAAATVVETEAISTEIGNRVKAGAKTEVGVDANLSLAINQAPIVGSTIAKMVDHVTGAASLNKTKVIAVSKKPFDILHPTKKGHRLRYVSLEGPDAEVYVRGKLKGNNTIHLPDYWKGLVDPESITVNLTPIGSFQPLYYEEVEWCSIIKVINSDGGPINCSYTIYAERIDTEKNIPEYKGLTTSDYPGDNDEYRL